MLLALVRGIALVTAISLTGCQTRKAESSSSKPSSAKPDTTQSDQKQALPTHTEVPSAPAASSAPTAPPSEVTSPSSATPPSAAPLPGTGDSAHDWALKYERTESGPEADLVARTGDINNLGFGWPPGFDPFSGKSTPVHKYPWETSADEPAGTDRILLGSSVDPAEELRDPVAYNRIGSDGYSSILNPCEMLAQPCKERQDSLPRPITLAVGALPSKINGVLVQVFVDDFQSRHFHSHFQVSLNGTRIPNFEDAVNALDQTGPIGKLITLRLLPEYWPMLNLGSVQLLIDDPTTRVRDGYAVDFVRILVNPHNFKYRVSLSISVLDADTRKPIPGASVNAALESASTDRSGKCELKGIPAGLVVAAASAPGYDEDSVPVDLPAGEAGITEILLHQHEENTSVLERSIAQTGSATIYGIHFDTDSAKLKADSLPALNAILGLIQNHRSSHWLIAGHTDNQGSVARNQPLSEQRAAAVINWLKEHGANATQLVPQGFGSSRPVADNATLGGRALNRRVEVALAR